MPGNTRNTSEPTDHRERANWLAARESAIKRAGEAALAGSGIEPFDPSDDTTDYAAYAARVASVRQAGELTALRRLQRGVRAEDLLAEMDRAAATRAIMPVATAAVPVTISSIVHPPTAPAPALGKAAGAHHHDHEHDGGLVHGADGSHSHAHTHLDGTTHEHAHLHGHEHHDDHGDAWRLASGHSHAHLHAHDHMHTYRTGEPIDLAMVAAEITRGRLTSSGKASSTGASINAGYAAGALKRPPVGAQAQTAASGKTKSPAETVVPSVVGHRDLMNTEDAAALDFGMPPLADEATPTPTDSLDLDESTLHEGGHQPQAALGQSDMQVPRAGDIGALIDLFKMGVINRAQVRTLLGLDRLLDHTRATASASATRLTTRVQFPPYDGLSGLLGTLPRPTRSGQPSPLAGSHHSRKDAATLCAAGARAAISRAAGPRY